MICFPLVLHPLTKTSQPSPPGLSPACRLCLPIPLPSAAQEYCARTSQHQPPWPRNSVGHGSPLNTCLPPLPPPHPRTHGDVCKFQAEGRRLESPEDLPCGGRRFRGRWCKFQGNLQQALAPAVSHSPHCAPTTPLRQTPLPNTHFLSPTQSKFVYCNFW